MFGGQLGWRTWPRLGVRGVGSHHTTAARNGEGENGQAGYQGHSTAQRNTGISPSRRRHGAQHGGRHDPLARVQPSEDGPDVGPEGSQFATPVLTNLFLLQLGKLRPQRRGILPNQNHSSRQQESQDLRPAFTAPAGSSGNSNPLHLCPGRPAARSGPGSRWCLRSSGFPRTGTSSLQRETWDGCF